MIRNTLLAAAILAHLTATAQTGKIQVHIQGIRSATGALRLGFYQSQEDFKNEKPSFIRTVEKTNMAGNMVSAEFGVPSGTWGIALLDDENKNSKMDFRFMLPKEGFGFSNYKHSGLTRPTFDKFSFPVTTSGATKVVIDLKYM
jgi:uncharacterized protein (DUF2141 family)